jgi:hypothetical protein
MELEGYRYYPVISRKETDHQPLNSRRQSITELLFLSQSLLNNEVEY